MTRRLARAYCLLGAHDWPAWSPWARRRDGVFVSTRKCRRCPRVAVLEDGVFDLEDGPDDLDAYIAEQSRDPEFAAAYARVQEEAARRAEVGRDG